MYFTKIFNLFTSHDYIYNLYIINKYKKEEQDIKFINTAKNKLTDIFKRKSLTPIDYFWKGTQYYYKSIFGINSVLDGIVPLEIYKQRNNLFLHDYICGHPLASNGWFKESLDKCVELGIFN